MEKTWEFYTRSRYPTVILGEIKLPEEIIDERIAKDLLETVRKTLEITKKILYKIICCP